MSKRDVVTVKYVPPKTDEPVLEMANVRIEIDEDHPEQVWIWMIENGVKVEGGSFPLEDFINMIVDYYNSNY